MSWVKRNVVFLVGSGITIALFVVAVVYLVRGYVSNQRALRELNAAYDELRRLYTLDPHPGSEKVDNIALAREQQEQVRAYIRKAAAFFRQVPPIPSATNLTTEEFTARLRLTLDQLQREAARASVVLPRTNYAFTFESIRPKVKFEQTSLPLLASQLGEIKAICDVLFAAKINAIENIRRERVCPEDSPETAPADYLAESSITNDIAVLTPYEVAFRCFSSELAAVLEGLANSPYTFVIKYLDVEPISAYVPGTEGIEGAGQYGGGLGTGAGGIGPEAPERFGERPLFPRGGFPEGERAVLPPGPGGVPGRPMPVPGRGGAQTMLSETPYRVVMQVYVVKLSLLTDTVL